MDVLIPFYLVTWIVAVCVLVVRFENEVCVWLKANAECLLLLLPLFFWSQEGEVIWVLCLCLVVVDAVKHGSSSTTTSLGWIVFGWEERAFLLVQL